MSRRRKLPSSYAARSAPLRYAALYEPKRSWEQASTVIGLPIPPQAVLEARHGAVANWAQKHLGLTLEHGSEVTARPGGVLIITPRWGLTRSVTLSPMDPTQ